MNKCVSIFLILLIYLGASPVSAINEEDERIVHHKDVFFKEMIYLAKRIDLPEKSSRIRILQIMYEMKEMPAEFLEPFVCVGGHSYLPFSNFIPLDSSLIDVFHGKLRFCWEYLNKIRPLNWEEYNNMMKLLSLKGSPTIVPEILGIIRVLDDQENYADPIFLQTSLKKIITAHSALPTWIDKCPKKKGIEIGKILANYYGADLMPARNFIYSKSEKVQFVISMIRLEKIRQKFLNYEKHDVSYLIKALQFEIITACKQEQEKRKAPSSLKPRAKKRKT